MKKSMLLLILFIIAFLIGFITARFTIQQAYKNIDRIIEIQCRTKDKKDAKLNVIINFDNNDRRSEKHLTIALQESFKYVLSFYTFDEIKTNSAEISALTLEDTFNRVQDKGFKIYKLEYSLKE